MWRTQSTVEGRYFSLVQSLVENSYHPFEYHYSWNKKHLTFYSVTIVVKIFGGFKKILKNIRLRKVERIYNILSVNDNLPCEIWWHISSILANSDGQIG